MQYREIRPRREIANFVSCFWQLRTTAPLPAPFKYRVVSDGCIDVFFVQERREESFAMGFCRKFVEFPLGTEFSYCGVRFFPSAFPYLFKINASTLSGNSRPLEQVVPWLADRLRATATGQIPFIDLAKQMEDDLSGHLAKVHFEPDARLLDALRLILQYHGHLQTQQDLNTGISPRQLRRVFKQYIGTTPKVFCQVVRFQYILNTINSAQHLQEDRRYLDVGFYDQAHFIKEFKRFYGVTPMVAFG